MAAICKNCIDAVTNGSLVALVQCLRSCLTCCADIAEGREVGHRMLLLACQRFNLHLIADEWEAQNKKDWVQEQESRYAHFGLRIKTVLDAYRNWEVHMSFGRSPIGSNFEMSVKGCFLTTAMRRATAALCEVTSSWSLLPGVMETDPTGRIIFKPKPDFVEES